MARQSCKQAVGAACLVLMGLQAMQPARADGWPRGCDWQRDVAGCFHGFHDGRARVPTGELWKGQPLFGYIDTQGRMVIKPQFARADDFAYGIARVRKGDHWGYIRRDGTWLLKPVYDSASDFNADGAAMVERDDIYSLVDRSGRTLKALPAGSRYSAVWNQRDRSTFRVELPAPAPVAWNAMTGNTIDLPAGIVGMQPGEHGGAAIRVRVNDPAGPDGSNWGLIDTQGNWLAKPSVMGAGWRVQTDGTLVVVLTKDGMRLLDRHGKLLARRDYRSIRWLLPGVWWASDHDRKDVLVDDKGRELATFKASQQVQSNDEDFAFFSLDNAVLLVHAGGKIKRIKTPKYNDGKLLHGLIWLYGNSSSTVAILDRKGKPVIDAALLKQASKVKLVDGRIWLWRTDRSNSLIGVFDLHGKPVLDDAVVKKLQAFTVFPIKADGDEDTAGTAAGSLPLATVHDRDARRWGVLTTAGKLVFNRQWEDFASTYGATYPFTVTTRKGRVGAIDGLGQWVIPPDYKRMVPFAGHYTVAWRADDGRGVVLDRAGHEHAIRPSILDDARSIQGNLIIFSQRVKGKGRVSGLWSIGREKVIAQPQFDDLHFYGNGQMAASVVTSKGQTLWGLVTDDGKWVTKIASDDYQAPKQLTPDLYLYQQEFTDDGSSNRVYRIVSASRGKPITPWLADQPKAAGSDRFVIQPVDGGVQLIDTAGKVLISIQATPKRIDVASGIVAMRFGEVEKLLDSRGQWVSKAVTHATTNDADKQGLVVFTSDRNHQKGFKDAATGKKVIGAYFSDLEPFHDGLAAFQRKRISGDLYGFINRKGELAIPAAYENVTSFRDGQALVADTDGDVYFIDKQGRKDIGFGLQCGWVTVTDGQGKPLWKDPSAPSDCDNNSGDDSQGETS